MSDVQVQVDELRSVASTLRTNATAYSSDYVGGGLSQRIASQFQGGRWFIGNSDSLTIDFALQDLSDSFCASWAGLDDRVVTFADMTDATAAAYEEADGQFGDNEAPDLVEDSPYKI